MFRLEFQMLKTGFKFFAIFNVFAVQNSCFAQISTFSGTPANSPPNFGPVSSVSSFPNAFSSAVATSDAFGQTTFSFHPGNTFSPFAASASANAASSSQPTQPSTNPSSLETFISTFTNAVHSSPVLADVFDLSETSPQSFADFIYHYVHVHSMSRGISDPHDIATYVTQPIAESFKVPSYPMLVRINANAMGKHLLAEGILNDTNAASLASAFANEMEKSAKQTVEKSFQESKFEALGDGYVEFLKAQGLDTREKLPVVGKYFGNEIRLAGGNFSLKRSS